MELNRNIVILLWLFLDRLCFASSFERQRDFKHPEICRESQKDLHKADCSNGEYKF